jgi:hypothetical protein
MNRFTVSRRIPAHKFLKLMGRQHKRQRLAFWSDPS